MVSLPLFLLIEYKMTIYTGTRFAIVETQLPEKDMDLEMARRIAVVVIERNESNILLLFLV